MAESRDRLWLPRVYKRAQQPCPGRQGLKPRLFIATAQPGQHLLITSCCSIPGPLCNSPWQHHETGPSARCARTRANRIWLAACLPPALCLQHPAHGSAPRGGLVRDPQARGCDMKASLPWGLLPVCRSLRQPQLTGPGGPGEDVSQMAHTTASSNAGWSTPEPGRAGMLRAVGIPSSCCSKLATPGTMLSPAAGSPRRTPLQGVTTGPSQGRSWAGRWAALQGPCGSRGGQEEPPSLLTAGPRVLGPAGPEQCPHTAGEGSCSLASSSTTC